MKSPIQTPVLVACNIYVSLGGRTVSASMLLKKMLLELQSKCRTLREEQRAKQPLSSQETEEGTNIPSVFHSDNQHGIKYGTNTGRNHTFASPLVVHAFSDAPYGRSSFHLAGTASDIASIASLFTSESLRLLLDFKINQDQNNYSNITKCKDNSKKIMAHPNVGLIDHVCIMPLFLPEMKQVMDQKLTSLFEQYGCNALSDEKQKEYHRVSAGEAAIQVGKAMSDAGCKVLYYGWASPSDHKPLSELRREQTSFFKSGGLEQRQEPLPSSKIPPGRGQNLFQPSFQETESVIGTACVGAPPNFVENFNIRLGSTQCESTDITDTTRNKELRGIATRLCKHIRERDGGLPGVEGLTLPYKTIMPRTSYGNAAENCINNLKYEVACNLLKPDEGSREKIRHRVLQWITSNPQFSSKVEVEAMYGVGTTQQLCIESMCNPDIDFYDEKVRRIFSEYLIS